LSDKDKYIELVNEGIQSSDLTLETAKDVEKAFLNLNSLINNAASAITPKPPLFAHLFSSYKMQSFDFL
jgi:hypothetical protein